MNKRTGRKTLFEFNNSIEYLIEILNDARFVTLKKVAGITVEELNWQYDKGWNSIGSLLEHINSLQTHFRIRKLEKREYTELEKEKIGPGLMLEKYLPRLITNKSLDDYTAALKNSNELLRKEINKLDLKEFKESKNGFNEFYNLSFGLYHLAEDEIHHRGQITLLRKLYQTENKTP